MVKALSLGEFPEFLGVIGRPSIRYHLLNVPEHNEGSGQHVLHVLLVCGRAYFYHRILAVLVNDGMEVVSLTYWSLEIGVHFPLGSLRHHARL